jgi:protein-disulfide isomerase
MKYIFLIFSSLFLLSSCTADTGKTTTPTVSKTIEAPTFGGGVKKIDIYLDYQCPACINFSKTLWPIIDEYAEKGQLQVTYKQFPLTSIHQNAYRDALAAMCAQPEWKFREYKKAIYALEESKRWANVTDEARVDLAVWVGLDKAVFAQCLAEEHYKARVDQDMKDGDLAWVSGTPTLILDGKKLDLGLFRNEAMFTAFMNQYLWVTPAPAAESGAVMSGSGL